MKFVTYTPFQTDSTVLLLFYGFFLVGGRGWGLGILFFLKVEAWGAGDGWKNRGIFSPSREYQWKITHPVFFSFLVGGLG